MSNGALEKSHPKAYAWLTGPKVSFYMKRLKIMLGRTKSISDENFFGLSDTKKVSKKQALIKWHKKNHCFQIKNLGRNKIYINNKELLKDKSEFLLHHSAIQIGDCCFYFMLPEMN